MKLTGRTDDVTAYHCREENYYYKQGKDLVDDLAEKGIIAQSGQALEYVSVHGKLAETLGFKDGEKISEIDFDNLLGGRNRKGEQVSRKHKVHAIDLTFSAPKTVSIAGLVMGGATAQAVVYAHTQAVKDTMKEIETFAYGRLTSDTKDHTGKMVWVQVNDGFSREKDPHLHTHCIVMNLTEVNGKVVALDGREIMKRDFNQLFGAIYREKLAERLSKDIGLGITYAKSGEWHLDKVSRECVEVFSKRRQQILEAKQEGKRDFDAWRSTREEKDMGMQSKAEILMEWRRILRETPQSSADKDTENKKSWQKFRSEWSREAVYSIEAEQERTQNRAELTEDQGWQLALRRATENEATVTKEALLHQYICERMRKEQWHSRSVGMTEIDLERQVKEGKIVKVGNYYTSWEMVRTEREYIKHAAEKTEVSVRDARKALIDYQVKQEKKLSAVQLKAAERILESNDMLTVVQGDAGAGKTTAMKAVAEIYKEQGTQVIGVCMQGIAAQNLEEETGVRCVTLKTFFSPSGRATAGAKRVIIFDEASMLDSRNAVRLFKLARHKGDKIILVGDRNQLESIAAGRVFDRLVNIRERHGDLIELNENYRQRDEGLREAVGYARTGEMLKSLVLLDKRGDIIEIPDKFQRSSKDISPGRERREAVAKHYDKDTLIIAGTTLARDEINSMIRAGLLARGELNVKKEREYEMVRTDIEGIDQKRKLKLTEGEIITFTKNEYKEYDIRNGERAKIIKLPMLDKRKIIAETEDGRRLEIDTRKYKNIDYGYALTTYKAQGQTYNKVVIEADTNTPSVNDMRSQYVNITRARDSVKIYTDDKESLKECAEILAHKRDTLDKIDITLEQAMQSEERLKERALENLAQRTMGKELQKESDGLSLERSLALKRTKIFSKI